MVPIRVCHVIKTLNLGGAESNLLNLTKVLDPNRFEIHVAYSVGGELEPRFQVAGIRLFKFADQSHKLKSLATFKIVKRLKDYFQKEKIDIVHTHTFNAHVWGGAAAKLAGCKILEHVHDSRYMDPVDFRRRGETSQQYTMIKYFKNISDCVVVLTRQNYEFVIENRIYPAQRVWEIQNGIDLSGGKVLSSSEKEKLRNRFGVSLDQKVVLTPIRFSPEKNLEALFKIVLEVAKKMPNAVCLIAGDGPEKGNFEVLIKKAGAENQIKTIGFYPDIPKLLNIVDVFLLPSTIELHSIAIMEAMRQKVPVVVSQNVGCNDEFIQNWENGILMSPFTVSGWADAIVHLLKDPELRMKMGNAGF
ncbi:MAG: glycosyltransferase family 4 protein, partial [Candidatus Omnitrophica bacterium]|nr:glycosyltransferase family 4 protein [Candidatus Omnitrophota bacterium]